MSKSSIVEKDTSVLRSLNTQLLVWFLLLALVPMTVVGAISYRRAQESLIDLQKNKMAAVSHMKGNEIRRLFEEWKMDVRDAVIHLSLLLDMREMIDGFRSLGARKVRDLYLGNPDTDDAGDGTGYSAVHAAQHPYFTKYIAEQKFMDVLIVDLDGNVIYTVRKTAVFGTNLKSGPFRNSGPGRLFDRLADRPGSEVVVVDVAPYEESVPLFLGSPVEDDGVRIGYIAYQMPFSEINAIMKERRGMGKTGESYLVGPDMRLRSDTALGGERYTIAASFLQPQPAHIQSPTARKALAGETGVEIVEDYRGRRVISAYDPLPVADLGWAVLSEVDLAEAEAPANLLQRIVVILVAVSGGVVVLIALLISRKIVSPIRRLTRWSRQLSSGDLSTVKIQAPDNEIGVLSKSFENAVESLRAAEQSRENQAWFKEGTAKLDDVLRGDYELETLSKKAVAFVTEYLEAQIGALYVDAGDGVYRMTASYAYTVRKRLANAFRPGEGLVGQAAWEKSPLVLTDVPEDYLAVTSGLGEKKPRHILVCPLVYDDEAVGVVEIGKIAEFSGNDRSFLEEISERLATVLRVVMGKREVQEALEKTQKQAEALAAQQEELKSANEELEEQTQRLQTSEEELKAQREELQVTNEELEEKTQALEEKKEQVEERNRVLKQTQEQLEKKARELEVSSRYKSEFLANMSHELRTPLNSLLILAQNLAANKKGTLDEEQQTSAGIIHKSGKDLLNLINEILDLSKIEAGKMSVNAETIPLSEALDRLSASFRPQLEEKGLRLDIEVADDAPAAIETDRQRLEQILQNLMSNAIKFTEEGGIFLSCRRPPADTDLARSGLNAEESIAISVADTGIGIPEELQLEIFEAFQQGDGSVSRKYGGTGLGLSICRELSKLLGGEIQLVSTKGEGATFTVILPEKWSAPEVRTEAPPPPETPEVAAPAPADNYTPAPSIEDDRNTVAEGDRTILVIEDDLAFAKILYDTCNEKNFRCIHAGDGTAGIELAETVRPDAVILDLHLPDMEGWAVLERLKGMTATRHIPVHIMSVEKETIDAYRKGAIGYLAKPVDQEGLQSAFERIETTLERKIKRLLIVEDDGPTRDSLVRLIGNGDVKSHAVASGKKALRELETGDYDCVILDLKLPDISGFELLRRLEEKQDQDIPPIIVYTGRELTREEEWKLQQRASSIIVKGVRSQERLLDETALFLHRVIENLPDKKRKMISSLYEKDAAFDGKKILVVDDDMRNVFAISKVLEERNVEVFRAGEGKKALEILDRNPGIDLVIMDIMMPVMDGYETMEKIRAQERFRTLPIIAVTAKAMREDRDKCIAAGANDYLPKPVDIDRLLTMLRVWLYK